MRTSLNAAGKTGLLISAVLAMFACNKKPMSVRIEDKSLGFNGSFESGSENLPVNWQLYTTETVPSGDFDIFLDTQDHKEGQRSLKFEVRDCASSGGWHSPGIAKEISANPGETFEISFWVKNQGSTFRARVSGISATKGISETIVESNEQINDWKRYQYLYTVPEKMNALRLEVNVLSPGTFQIDDIHIERN